MKYYNTLIENIPVTIELIRTPFLELGRKMIKETERIIPESKITEITYVCDYCNEEFAFKENLDEHQIAHIKTVFINEYDIYYLKNKQDADCVLKETWGDESENRFSKPGWYYIYQDSRPCSRGCCTEYTKYLEPISYLKDLLQEKVKQYEKYITKTNNIIAELNKYE